MFSLLFSSTITRAQEIIKDSVIVPVKESAPIKDRK
jgi:hypothetical protein